MKTKVYLAPMSGTTDLPMRLMSREFGARFCFLEMLDSKSMPYKRPKTNSILKTIKKDSPVAAQLLGSEPSIMLDAAQKVLELVDISFLDINSGCPAPKVIRKGSGAALLEKPQILGKIIKKLSSNLKIPVTVKLRTGFYKKDIGKCVKIARIAEENGASQIFIHGRTMSQGYAGEIDYESIKAVKSAVKIPVSGSGNIFGPQMAKKMIDETNCDGILVARGALGNPWIFRDIENYLKTGKTTKAPSLAEKKKALKQHLAYIEKYSDMKQAHKIGFMGKVAMWYLKGLPGATRTRDQICRTKSYEELLKLINLTAAA